MADLNLKTSPFYDNSQDEFDKNYTNLVFLPGMSVQNRELTGIGELANLRINEVASNALGNNTVLTGGNILNVNLNSTPKTVSISETKSIVTGYITTIPATLVEITGIGLETIYIEVVQELVSYLEDDTLLDPAEGFDNYNNEGAFRKKTYGKFTLSPSGTRYIKIAELTNGVLTWTFNTKTVKKDSTVNDVSDVLYLMKQRTYETSGNYLVSGFTPSYIECLDENKIGISITGGVAYVLGDRFETSNKNLYIPRNGVVNIVQDEPTNVGYGSGTEIFDRSHGYEYVLDKPNAIKVNKVVAPSVITREITRTPSDANGSDHVEANLLEIIAVTSTDGSIVYNVNTDWVKSGARISWLPAGSEPASGSTYKITYSYNRILQPSQYKLLKGTKKDVNYVNPTLTSNEFSISISGSNSENILIRDVYQGITNVESPQTLTPNINNVCDLEQTNIKYQSVSLFDGVTEKIEDTDYFVNYETGLIQLKFTPIGTISCTYSYFTTKLSKNQNYSVNKNKITFATVSSPRINVNMTRSNLQYDNKSYQGTVNVIKYFRANGEYNVYNGLGSTPDYTVGADRITWNNDLSSPIVTGDSYVMDLTVLEVSRLDNLNNIYIEYLYENDAEALDADSSYPSVLKVDLDLAAGENIIVDYEYYLPRIDNILLTNQGIIENMVGPSISRSFANTMTIPTNKVLLAKLFLKPYSTFGNLMKSTNFRLRMTDIRQMYSEVDDIKYNLALTDLEKEAEATAPVANMRGIFTDNFDSLNKLDTGYAYLTACGLDPTEEELNNYPLHIAIPTPGKGYLGMNYTSVQKELTINEGLTTARLMNGRYYLSDNSVDGYKEVLWQTQPKATKFRSVAEGLNSLAYIPKINIIPDSYMFIEKVDAENSIINNVIDNSVGVNMANKVTTTTAVSKARIGNNIYTTTTTTTNTTTYYKEANSKTLDLGTFIKDVEQLINIKPIEITVYAEGFLPNTDFIECFFDNKKVELTIVNGKGSASTNLTGAVKTDENGEFNATFMIPNDCRYGIREVKITSTGGLSATCNFFGSGIKAESANLSQTNTTINVKSKVNTKITTKTVVTCDHCNHCNHCYHCYHCEDCGDCGTNCSHCAHSCARAGCATTPLCQTIYINNPALSNFVLSDIPINSDVFVSSANVYFKNVVLNEDSNEFFISGFLPLTDSGLPLTEPEKIGPAKWAGSHLFTKHNAEMIAEGANTDNPSLNQFTDKATVPYKIDFTDTPIYLEGGKGYGFVVGDVNDGTVMWVAEVGASQTFNDVTTGLPVTDEPARGVLLSSPNGQTWDTYIKEDLKYDMYIADFSQAANVTSFNYAGKNGYRAEIRFNDINVTSELNGKKANFFIFNGSRFNSNDGSAYVEYYYNYDDNADWVQFGSEEKIEFKVAITTLKIKAVLITTNKYVSPYISPICGIILGRYSNIGYYVSRSAMFNEFNKITYYLDKIYNTESGTNIEAYYSVDDGQIWKQVMNPTSSKLLFTDIERIKIDESKARMYQWGYVGDILMNVPQISSGSVVEAVGHSGGTLTDGTYSYRVSLVNHDGSETNPVSCTARSIALSGSTVNAVKFNVEFDPSASGFKVYRSTDEFASDNVMVYDSTVTSTAASIIDTGTQELTLFAGDGTKFPNKGRIRVSRTNVEGYAWYNYTGKNGDILTGISSKVDCGNYESDSDFVVTIGDIVELFDYDIKNLESINARDGGNGKVPIYLAEVDTTGKYYYQTSFKEDSKCIFTFIDDGARTTNTGQTTVYNINTPVYVKARKIKFMIKMYNDNDANMDYMYALPEVRRFMANCSFNSELLP